MREQCLPRWAVEFCAGLMGDKNGPVPQATGSRLTFGFGPPQSDGASDSRCLTNRLECRQRDRFSHEGTVLEMTFKPELLSDELTEIPERQAAPGS